MNINDRVTPAYRPQELPIAPDTDRPSPDFSVYTDQLLTGLAWLSAHSRQVGDNAMSNEAVSSEEIGVVLNGLFASGEAKRQAQFRLWADTPACRDSVVAIQRGNLEEFYFRLIYPFKQVVDGLLQSSLPGQRRAHFLLSNYDFVRSHFRRIIETHDGFTCCADKTRAILSRLLAFYITEKPIVFDPQEAYTYHHPKTVFTTHKAIVEFFEALFHLHAGNPDPYLTALMKVAAATEAVGGKEQG
jgi:hypothetical protein